MELHEKSANQHPKNVKEKEDRLLNFLRAAPSSELLWRHPHALLKRVATLRRAAPSFARTVDWRAVPVKCVAWAKRPTNGALLVWLAFVAGGVAFVFLLMAGALNSAVPDAARRRRWTEVANQVLNALFTVMCVYQHPRLCHHLVLLLRWRAADDVAELRQVYYKNVRGLKRERLHVAVVVLLLHATCFAQYAYCALFWFFSGATRPDWAVDLFMALGVGFPVLAALYMVYGPLGGRKMVLSDDDEKEALPVHVHDHNDETKEEINSNIRRSRAVVTTPEWAGGLFDLADDPTAAALSLSCTFCVFGWNMERLGMGNMYVHVFTFALLCAAPVLVFAVAALNVHDATLGSLVGATGAVLSVLGLLYGGFWRARLRRRLGLPACRSVMCCSVCVRPAVVDYVKWLLCAPCALAQEVRTGNMYDVEDGRIYVKEGGCGEEEGKPVGAMAPLEREGCVAPLTAVKCVVAVDAPPVPMMIQDSIR